MSICKVAASNIDEVINKSLEEFKKELLKLPEDKQRNISLNLKGVDDYLRDEATREKKEKYPHKDKNQIKFQVDDKTLKQAKKFIKLYRIRSVPALARNLFEMYLKSFYKDEKMPDDIDFLELFEGLTDIGIDDYQDTKRGGSI